MSKRSFVSEYYILYMPGNTSLRHDVLRDYVSSNVKRFSLTQSLAQVSNRIQHNVALALAERTVAISPLDTCSTLTDAAYSTVWWN